MPLRPGESFLQGSARVKRQRASAQAVAPFVPQLVLPPKTRVPPVPKAVRDWEKKKPLQKVKEAGFLGAVATDKAVTRYRAEREFARMADVRAKVPSLGAPDPAFAQRDRARAELTRLQNLPRSQQRGDYWTKLAQARSKAGGKHALTYDIERGLWAGSEPIREYLSGRAWEPGRTSYMGVPTPRIIEDVAETTAKMAVGLPVGVAGMVRHPLRVPGQVKDIVSDMAQPLGLAMASTSSSKARQKLWEDFLRESLTAMEEQYGPEASWGESVRMSYDQGLIAALQGLAVVAPAFKLGSIAKGVSPRLALTEEGLKLQTGKGLRQAIRESSYPADPRIVTLRGGKEAMGQDVEINWARSPMTRALVQRPFDAASRRISEETPIVGKLSQAQRAARASRKQVKRDIRRLQAEAANYATAAGRASEAEQLRTFYMRGKPEDVDEDAWLQAQLDDVNEMIAGREFIRPGKADPKLISLQRKVATLQKKVDRSRATATEAVVARRLAPLTDEERSLKAKLRSARERNLPTEELTARLGNVQDQLRVARGETVGAVADSPERAQLKAVFDQQLGRKQSDLAIKAYDLAARAASPDNPSAFYSRILTQYADDPEAAGLDLANAFLQEAGPRRSLRGAPEKFTPEAVEQFQRYDSRVITPHGEGWIREYDHPTKTAYVALEDPEAPGHVSEPAIPVKYEDLEDPYAVAPDEGTQPVFYSEMQRVIEEKLPKKISPDDLVKFLKGKQIKDVELEWSGLNDWVEALRDSGVRTLDKQEVIDYLADPLNAYDLTETLWEQDHYDYPTKWGPGDTDYGVSLYDVPGDYKELMISLPGDQVYSSSGHMPGVKNPIVQIRFWEIPNDRGKRILFIDEMQSDWFARIKDNDWIVKTGASEAEIERINQVVTTRVVELHERVNRELGIPYDAISEFGGYSHGPSAVQATVYYLQEMVKKLDRDFRDAHDLGQGPLAGQENAALLHDWLNTPERAAVGRLLKHATAVQRKVQRLGDKQRQLTNAPHDMPYKKGWEQLALKRMVGWAVQNGFDEVHWTQGIVPAVRYEKTVPSQHLGGGPSDYDNLTEHPQYPDESDYQSGYTSHEYEFADALGDVDGYEQHRLFGITAQGDPMRNFRWNSPDSWDIPGPVPMSETMPVSLTAKELGYGESTTDSPWGHEYTEPDPGELIYMEEGPFADQFVKVGRRNEDGTFDVFPSYIAAVRVTGRADSSDYKEYEVEIDAEAGTVYGSGETVTDAFWDAGAEYRALSDSSWFDDFQERVDRYWNYETDDEAYSEAVDQFHRDVENGYIEVESEGGYWSAEDVAQLPYEATGNPYRYDTIVTSNAKKAYKKYGVEVEDSSIPGAFSSMGHREALSAPGRIPTWSIGITPELRSAVEGGQSFFQAAYPITGGRVVAKGAVELLANRNFRLTLFRDADLSTALHELGHIAIYDMDENDLTTLSRELAAGRPFAEWRRDDHERFTRAWESYFRDGYASNTSLRNVFKKIAEWMKRIYNGHQALGDPISPEVRRVFDKRLGRAGLDEADYRLPENPELTRWGVQLSQAKDDLERYEARAEIARQKGTDEALRAELRDVQRQREKAEADQNLDLFNELTTEMRQIAKELDDRDALNASRNERRQKLLHTRQGELVKALKKPDSRRYEGATAAADFFQSEREDVLRGVFGDLYDPVFAGRKQQQSAWLAARGVLPEADVGEGRGHQPMRRRGGVRARIREAAAPVTRRMGKPRTDKLNLHKSNEMILWQQGDYQADINVLHEEYLRALTFGYQHDMRRLLHQIGEPVDVSGPKEGWYLIDLDATPLPREWQGLSSEEIDAELQNVRDALAGDDSQLALQLQHFAENWLHTDAGRALHPEHGYKNVRQVHPKIVHQLMLPYTGNQLWNPVVKGFSIANTLARTSLIYMSPGYIPSNVLANAVLLFAERGIFALRDLYVGAKMVTKDRELGRRARAEMGETMTTSKLRADTGEVLATPRRLEGKLASGMSYVADDWVRAAAWSGIASKHGYRTRDRQIALLDGKTEKTRRDRERIATLATRAMIDFDRLSPWEQRYLRPIVFVWPFMRGASAWPIEYVKEHPFRAGAAVALTQGYGEEAREEMGPVPEYFSSLVPIDLDAAGGEQIANVGSLNPVAPFADFTLPLAEMGASAWTGEKIGTFRNLAGFLAPQNDVLLQLVRGQGEFGQALSVQEILKDAAPELIPAPGLPILLDILDETRPAYQLNQGALDTFLRRTFRFTPQEMNLSILNQQAKARGEKEVTNKLAEARRKARSAWNQVAPGDHMPRVIEDSIRAYYIVQANRALLKDEIKKKYRASWQPTKRDPSLSPLQEAAIVYDVLVAQHPDFADLEDPRSIYDKYGEDGVKIYKRNLERVLYQGKRKADEAITRAKQVQKVGAAG